MPSARRPLARALLAVAACAALAAGLAAAPASAGTGTQDTTDTAGTAVQATRSTPATVTGQALPTWQIDGVVWDTVTVGDIVYAVGDFDYARPPGTPTTSDQRVARHNILAFDITTGVITEFDHSLNGPGYRIAASPDGTTVYVGGRFTKVDGKKHNHLAAFDVATGELVNGFKAGAGSAVRAIAVSGSTVYVGGQFDSAGGPNGWKSRRGLAAFSRGSGNLTRWRPTMAEGFVKALAVLPGGHRIAVGGSFQRLNGKKKVGIGAVSATTGATRVWKSRPIPARIGERQSYVSDLIVSGAYVYATAVGDGGHWYDGRFAARASDGKLVWLDNCYGASLSGYVTGNVFYSVSHAHDCSSLGAFRETKPKTHYFALAETTYATGTDRSAPSKNSNYKHQPVPSLLHWFPTLNSGTFTGQHQAAWAITGNGRYVALAGEFTKVNFHKQQGLTRFAITSIDSGATPKWSKYTVPTPKVSTGKITVSWRRTWDADSPTLTYQLLRQEVGTDAWVPVKTLKASTKPWKLGTATVSDKGVTPGCSYTYRLLISDPEGHSYHRTTTQAVTAR
ncbi:hypothetical protein ACIB24_10735 [Spongisporangium articulatum]|uniref:Fibronectin type-III domain-containing protein n=1 Tax=Spongisporangium articulatum TaxID=3362603 RepID=A0ABW8API4_9ACTN